jgi:glycosyltransferase A (GT-A) superfamily protein (DUF2064 family)
VLEEFDKELRRLVDRLRSMPLTALAKHSHVVFQTCQQLVDLTGESRQLPRLADHAAGDQLAVVGADCRNMSEAAVTEATAALVRLRKALG